MQVRIRDNSFVDQIRYNVPFSCPTGLNSHYKKMRMAEDSSIDISCCLVSGSDETLSDNGLSCTGVWWKTLSNNKETSVLMWTQFG